MPPPVRDIQQVARPDDACERLDVAVAWKSLIVRLPEVDRRHPELPPKSFRVDQITLVRTDHEAVLAPVNLREVSARQQPVRVERRNYVRSADENDLFEELRDDEVRVALLLQDLRPCEEPREPRKQPP